MIKRAIISTILVAVLLCGCSKSDYIEPEKRTVVTAVLLNSGENLYEIILETVENSEDGEETKFIPKYIKGNAENLASALENTQKEISKEISLYHCPIIICDKSTYNLKSDEIYDFIIKTPQLSLAVDLIICENINAILEQKNKEDFLGYEISDAIILKNFKTELVGILKGKEKPCLVTVNGEGKIIVSESIK